MVTIHFFYRMSHCLQHVCSKFNNNEGMIKIFSLNLLHFVWNMITSSSQRHLINYFLRSVFGYIAFVRSEISNIGIELCIDWIWAMITWNIFLNIFILLINSMQTWWKNYWNNVIIPKILSKTRLVINGGTIDETRTKNTSILF